MTFVGWSFAALATAFGVTSALVTGLYLLRMRRRELPVPFAALWEQVTRAGRGRISHADTALWFSQSD